ncbi:MAG TPA: hypothetical protein VFL86_00770, partial [Burkholderiaceae bacterium]|nr:hypothetical protein [Burkholderiaceae bacterium]
PAPELALQVFVGGSAAWGNVTVPRGGRPPADCGAVVRELDATRSMSEPPPALGFGRCRESPWDGLAEYVPAAALHPLLLALLDRSIQSLHGPKAASCPGSGGKG